MKCKKYLVRVSHLYTYSSGWDVQVIESSEEFESNNFEELFEKVCEYEKKWYSYKVKVEYFKQSIEMLPTVVKEPVNDFGQTSQEVEQEKKSRKRAQYEELKKEFGEDNV